MQVTEQPPCKANKGASETNIIFRTKSEVGSLQAALAIFKEHDVDLTHIESRPARAGHSEYEFFVSTLAASEKVRVAVQGLSGTATGSVQVRTLSYLAHPYLQCIFLRVVSSPCPARVLTA